MLEEVLAELGHVPDVLVIVAMWARASEAPTPPRAGIIPTADRARPPTETPRLRRLRETESLSGSVS